MMAVVNVIGEDVIDVPVNVQDVTARHPVVMTMMPLPVTGHPVVVGRVVVDVKMTTIIETAGSPAIRVTMATVEAVPAVTRMNSVANRTTEATDLHLNPTGIRSRGTSNHQSENSSSCEC